ncbi:MAG: hypothetical protein WC140_04310 [Bacteroidales bacterium]
MKIVKNNLFRISGFLIVLTISTICFAQPYLATKVGTKLCYDEVIDSKQNVVVEEVLSSENRDGKVFVVTNMISGKDTIKMRKEIQGNDYFYNPVEGIYETMIDKGVEEAIKDAKKDGEEFTTEQINELQDKLRAKLKISGKSALYPENMKVGDKLPESKIKLKILLFSMKSYIEDREVIKEEDVTTSAGTFHCICLSQREIMKALGNKSDQVVEYYLAKNIGIVKSIAREDGKVVGTTTLSSIDWVKPVEKVISNTPNK